MADFVKFLKGTQAGYDALTTFIPGAFYLTEDTGKLFYGKTASAAIPLTQYIKGVTPEEFTALTSAQVAVGDYYYIPANNILAVCSNRSGANNKPEWTQINVDTNSRYDVSVSGNTISAAINLQEKNKEGSTVGTPQTVGFSGDTSWITVGKDGNNIKVSHKIKGSAAEATQIDSAQIGAAGQAFNISRGVAYDEAGHITSVATGTVTLPDAIADTDTKSALSTSGLNIQLTESNIDGTTIRTDNIIISANNGLTAEGIAATTGNKGSIVIKHNSKPTTGTALTPGGATGSINANRQFSALTGLVLDDYGHVASATLSTFTLPVDNDTKISGTDLVASAGVIQLHQTNNGNTLADIILPALYYDIRLDNETESSHRYITSDLGHLVTSGFIGQKLNDLKKELNGVTYRGIISAAPTSNVANGDMWMVGDNPDSSLPEGARPGDLIIAQGTEGADGYIASPTFDLVPSGNDIDSTYAFGANTAQKQITLSRLTGGASGETAGIVTFAGDTWLSPTVAGSNRNYTVTYTHTGPGTGSAMTNITSAETSVNYGGKIKALVDVIKDEKGHITGVTTKEYVLPGAIDAAYSLKVNSAGIILNKPNSATDQIVIQDAAAVTDAVNDIKVIKTYTATTNTIEIAHKAYTTSATNGTQITKNYGDVINVVTGLTATNGHVTAYDVTPIKLPEKVITNISDSVGVSNNKATVTNALSGGNTSTDTFDVETSSLQITSGTIANKSMAIDIVWGTF